MVGATTNHGYLHYDDLESLDRTNRRFVDILAATVNTRLEDARLPVESREELRALFKNNELSLSRYNLHKAIKVLGYEARFDKILSKLPTVKGAEIPDTRKRVKTR
ncbi:MAG: hypothetical protein WC607_04160 [Candidatus Micrarchaeia archaeon]